MCDCIMAPLYPARELVVPHARGRMLEIGVGTALNFGPPAVAACVSYLVDA